MPKTLPPELTPLTANDATSLDVALFAAASAAIGFILLAFPRLGLLAGLVAFIVLARRSSWSSERPDASSEAPGSLVS